MSELLNLLAKAFDTKGYPDDKNPKNWRKINGSSVHLDAYGNIDGGAGGKFNGAKCTVEKLPSPKKENTAKAPGETLASVAAVFNPKQDLQSQEQNANISTNQGGALNEVANAFEPNVTQNEIMQKKTDELLRELQGVRVKGQSCYEIIKQCIDKNKNLVYMGVQEAYSAVSKISKQSKGAKIIKGFLDNIKEQNKQLIDREMQHLAMRLVKNGYVDDDVTPLFDNKEFVKSIEDWSYYLNSNMSEAENYAMANYLGSPFSFEMNNALRRGDVHKLDKDLQEDIGLFDNLINKVPRLPQKTILHRYDSLYAIQNMCQEMGIEKIPTKQGQLLEMIGDMENVRDETISKVDIEKIDKLLSGATFSLPAYTSTSCDPEVNIFTQRPVVFRFLTAKGQKCIASPHISWDESEVVLPHDSKLTVDGVQLKDGKIEVYARIVKEE